MQTRESLVSALGGRPAITALGAVTLLVGVWAAAIPRPEYVIPTLQPSLEVRHIGANDPSPGFGGIELEVNSSGSERATTSDTVAAVLMWTAVGVVTIAAVVCLVLIWRAWRRAQDDRTPPASDAPDLDLETIAVAVAGDAPERLAALSAGTPGEGIIAAWTHLEATLHEAGVPLPPSRTSSEVTTDVLRRHAVDAQAIGTLAALYREARWSGHPLTEDDRTRAATAYRRLDADLRDAMAPTSRAVRG